MGRRMSLSMRRSRLSTSRGRGRAERRGEVRSTDGRAEPGDIVDVRAADRIFTGRGYINPRSTIAVRLLTRRKEAVDEGFFRRRLAGALGPRPPPGGAATPPPPASPG